MKEMVPMKVIKSNIVEKKLRLAKKYGLNKEKLIAFWKNIYLSRKLDDAEISMRKKGTAFFQISGAGHEGVLTAFGHVLRPGHDYFIPYYRDRALCLALGVTPYEMLCQANGNIGDTASYGRQMPVHFGSQQLNIVSASSCTGTQFLQAVGLAEGGIYLNQTANKLDSPPAFHSDEVVYVSCGDGTTSQGEFWESLTTACVNKLPVLFMVEDNGYAISVPVHIQTPGGSISRALEHFPDLKVFSCDGNCPIESYKTAVECIQYMREQRGPVLVHAHVTRPYSHSLSDDHSNYRTTAELMEEKQRDVFYSFPKLLIQGGVLKEESNKAIQEEINQFVINERQRAEETPWPGPETCEDHVFSEEIDIQATDFSTSAEFTGADDIPMAQTINSVLRSELKKNPLIRIFGEDVADFGHVKYLADESLKGKGGVFSVTKNCQREGVLDQVFNTPLAEANIIGRAIGMAVRGIKPVVEIQFFDYIWTAFMQLKNEMATLRYRSGGDFECPMVIRVPIGGYLKGGAIYHSQCGESLFTHIPGICVAYPANALDAAGLLRTAIRSDDPVLFLEHKHLYYQGYNRSADPGDEYMIPFGKGHLVREGADATIVTWGALVQKSVDAVKQIEKDLKRTIEIIDLRTLMPFDMDMIKQSLKKTNRILICHEETKTSGFAGEIAARINEQCFESLDAPILRVAAKDSPVAYCPGLEDAILPQVADIQTKLLELLNY
jgi:2-oxoisovalerate dehydrogenase E1 component